MCVDKGRAKRRIPLPDRRTAALTLAGLLLNYIDEVVGSGGATPCSPRFLDEGSNGRRLADLKKAIEQAACNLKDAIFDKGECATCAHNSELQSEMFSEAIASGSCTNPTCYKGKTEKQLEGISYGLKDEYRSGRRSLPASGSLMAPKFSRTPTTYFGMDGSSHSFRSRLRCRSPR